MNWASNLKVSAPAFIMAMLFASIWWTAYTTLVLLHDDAKFTQALTGAMDRSVVRVRLSEWITTVVKDASSIPSRDLVGNRELSKLRQALVSERSQGPLTDALLPLAGRARDEAVGQLDRDATPKSSVRFDLAPLLVAADVPVNDATAKSLGLSLSQKSISVPVLGRDELDALQGRYDLTVVARDWAGWVAFLLLAVSVVTSAKPLRTLAIGVGLVAVIAVLAPLLLARLAAWLAGTWLGDSVLGVTWISELPTPIVAAIAHGITPFVLSVAVAALLSGVLLGISQAYLSRRRPAV